MARCTQSRWGLRQRNVYLKEVDQVFRSLAKNPLMGRACDEVREGYRKLPHGAHVIYYKPVGEDELLIVRILHATTDVASRLGAYLKVRPRLEGGLFGPSELAGGW